MYILWHGQSCFEITATPAKNSQIKIIVDPFSEEVGLRIPKLEADIVLVTHSHYDHNNIKAISGSPLIKSGQSPFLISGPGEYEIKNVFIQGIASPVVETLPHLPKRSKGRETNEVQQIPLRPVPWRSAHNDKKGEERGENTVYTIEAENLKLCHLGDLSQKELTEEQLEKIGEIDVLMIPIGGAYTVSAKEALKIMAQIEPKITIPMHYALPKLKIKLDGLDKFLKSLGIKSIEPLSKLTIKQKDILAEEARIVVLKS